MKLIITDLKLVENYRKQKELRCNTIDISTGKISRYDGELISILHDAREDCVEITNAQEILFEISNMYDISSKKD